MKMVMIMMIQEECVERKRDDVDDHGEDWMAKKNKMKMMTLDDHKLIIW